LTKEVAYYKKEAVDNQEIVDQLALEGADEWQLKQPTLCVEESYAMVLESGNRLRSSIDELYSYLVRADDGINLSEGEGNILKEEAEALLEENCS
jgi:hypothetical protein